MMLLNFISPQPLVRIFTPALSSRHPQVSICMKTKSNDKSSKKRSSRSKSPPSSGAGFGTTTKSVTETPSKTASKQSSSPKSKSKLKEGEVMDEASGAAGDATPHRVNLENNPVSDLRDPSEDLKEPSPLLSLPILSIEEQRQLRFDLAVDTDTLIECFADAQTRADFSSIVVCNRHHITESLLYRFTSAILQTENDENRKEESENMRTLRKKLISYAWSFDFSFKRAILSAEKRILSVLQGLDIDKEVGKQCGRSTLEVNAFWSVLYAAVAAWEERGKEDPELVNIETQQVLTKAAEACGSVDVVLNYLSPCLKCVQSVFSEVNPEKQAEIISELSNDDVVELISLMESIKLLPSQAYGGLAERLESIVDYIRQSKYGLEILSYEPLRFKPNEIVRDSRLIEFSKRSSNKSSV